MIDEGVSLIVTVDNGVAGHEAIDYANQHGVDVVVTDHHELPETLPDAYAIIHPRHPEGDYPFIHVITPTSSSIHPSPPPSEPQSAPWCCIVEGEFEQVVEQ